MKKKSSKWEKEVRKAMIDKDLSMRDLANALNLTPQYLSSVINGRVVSEPAIKTVSDYLGISDDYDS